MYRRATLPPPLFVSNLRDGLTAGSINLLFFLFFLSSPLRSKSLEDYFNWWTQFCTELDDSVFDG